MTTNLDILSFLKADQEEKEKTKKEEKEIRAKERKEDMEHILSMIQNGVQKQVKDAIKPLEERLEEQEKVNKELYKRLDSLAKEVGLMKRDVSSQQQQFPVLPEPQGQQHPQVEKEVMAGFTRASSGREHVSMSSCENLCASARRVIGFSPIEPRMLEIQMNSYGARDREEAKLMEVKSYLKCEMKMMPSVIEKLNIIRIFPPAKPDWNVLYVEFGSDYEVDSIFSLTKNMVKRDHRVIRWIPKQMYARFRAVESLAYSFRQEEGLKTRVKIGRSDLMLSTRHPQSSIWVNRVLPSNFPPIYLPQDIPSSASAVQVSESPQENNDRRHSV